MLQTKLELKIKPIITTYPYKGIRLDFFEEKKNGKDIHFFQVTKGKESWKPLSVTAITGIIDKPALKFWSAKVARENLLAKLLAGQVLTEEDVINSSKLHIEESKAAAADGTIVHELIEKFAKGERYKIPEDNEKVQNGFLGFLRWVNEVKVKFVEVESVTYSAKSDYAGKLDAIANINGKLAVIDFKTSNAIYNEYRYQIAAYQNAKEEMTGKKYDTRWIIRCDKETGQVEPYELTDYKKDLRAFLGALEVKKREVELK